MTAQLSDIKLSPYQETLYNEWKLNPLRSEYNLVSDNDMRGVVDPKRLHRALNRMSQDYLLLHSVVSEADGSYWWSPDPEKRISFTFFNMPQTETQLLQYVKKPFDLNNESLLRVALIQLEETYFRIVLVAHHLIMDGAKERFTFSTISSYYNDDSYACAVSIPEQHRMLASFSKKCIAWVESNESTHTQFWCDQLSDLPGIDLSFLKIFDEDKSENNIGETRFSINEKVLDKLRHVTRNNGVTTYLFSLAIFAAVAYRYSQQEKFGFSIAVAIPGGEEFYYGASINPTIIAFNLSPHKTFSQLLNEIKNYFKLLKSADYHLFPLQRIPANAIDRNVFHFGFTQTHLKNQHYNLEGTSEEKVNSSLNIDLCASLLFYQEVENNLVNHQVLYQKNQIDAGLLNQFLRTYQRIFEQIVDDMYEGRVQNTISSYRLVEPDSYNLLVREWNRTDVACTNKSLQQLFEHRVRKMPEATAVIFDHQIWTYQALNLDSNRIAHYLRQQLSVQPDELIGLCLTPGYHAIVAMWAVVKSGAAYVPIDPNIPQDRFSFILDDTKLKALFVDGATKSKASAAISNRSIALIDLSVGTIKRIFTGYSTRNPACRTLPDHLAYVMYTSGTHGKPKGVMIEHRSLINYVTYLIHHNQLSDKTITSQFAAPTFDCSAMETYPTFLSGGTLCIIKAKDRADCNRVNDFFHQHNVNYAFLPTPVAEMFLSLKNTSLQRLMVCGEKLNKFAARPYRIINAYGPTEATVQTTTFAPDRDYLNIPIGRPISNMKCYVVDAQLNILPIGAVGELMIGGVGVARAYLNRPELNEKSFIANPFQSPLEKQTNKNARLYRTGDFVRWRPDGNLEFIKRGDEQIKIRGHRIELDEIQSRLLHYPDIQQVAVKVFGDTGSNPNKHVIAFYTTGNAISEPVLREFLAQHLPEYMLPTAFVHVEKMPLTAHGKLDKKQLNFSGFEFNTSYEAPINPSEKMLCSAFASILSLDEKTVGRNHSFLELGGDSLSVIRLTATLGKIFKVSAADIFELKTPARLALKLLPMSANLPQYIQQITLVYKNKIKFAEQDYPFRKTGTDTEAGRQYQQYLDDIDRIHIDGKVSSTVQSILLTGATGFLGCHILESLLTTTSNFIYLPVRAGAEESAFARISAKFNYYFNTDLNKYKDRIDVFPAALEKANLGLQTNQFQKLTAQVDSIIHCAALVKYFWPAGDYMLPNVQPTKNLLDLSKLTRNKNFHYISTIGVLLDGYVKDHEFCLLTEVSDLDLIVRDTHPYMYSKYLSEQLVMQYRSKGINGNIYRVGNLVMNSRTCKVQENIEENMLFSHIRAILNLEIFPEELAKIEISPVDFSASAIVKLVEKCPLKNQIYHLFNPHLFNLKKTLTERFQNNRESQSIEQFVESVLAHIAPAEHDPQFSYFFFLYQFWTAAINGNHFTRIRVAQNRTQKILFRYGLRWPVIKPDMLNEVIKKSYSNT